jgi:hypothetical protein
MRVIDTIVIHQSDSGFGTASLIDEWHRARGWSGIGYHRVILNGWVTHTEFRPECDGMIQAGRALECVGAHVRGHNATSIGICLIGAGPGWPIRLTAGGQARLRAGEQADTAPDAEARPMPENRAAEGYLTQAQWRALVSLCHRLIQEFGVPVERVLGHREFPGVTKSCPGFEVAELRNALRAQVTKRPGEARGETAA